MTCTGKDCFRCTKFSFYVLNLLFWIIGVSLLGLGIWLHVTNGIYLAVAPGYDFLTPAALCLASGSISIIIGFIGCCGAIVENKCMVISYCVLVVIIFCFEIAGGVAAFIGSEQLSYHIKDELHISLSERYPPIVHTDDDEAIVKGWEIIHTEFKCCGVDKFSDWYQSHGWPKESRVPDSCCIHPSVGCGKTFEHGVWFTQGCIEPITEYLESHMFAIGVTVTVMAGLQLLAVIGGMLFLCYWRRRKDIR